MWFVRYVRVRTGGHGLLLITPDDDSGRGQVLSTSTDNCRLLFTHGVQLRVQLDGRSGVRQRRPVHRH